MSRYIVKFINYKMIYILELRTEGVVFLWTNRVAKLPQRA
jgi:hypothetical protein